MADDLTSLAEVSDRELLRQHGTIDAGFDLRSDALTEEIERRISIYNSETVRALR